VRSSGSHMRWFLFYCFALIASYAGANAPSVRDNVGKWTVEHRRTVLTLSKQTASIDNGKATSELSFLCDPGNEFGVVGVMLVPFEGTFDGDQDPVPVLILRQGDETGRSDLSQRWRNANEFLFSDSFEDLTDLINLLMDKSTDADTSVHFRFSGGGSGQLKSNHIVVDAKGFEARFAEFENECASGH
jgi:hypothetical protein